MKLVTALVSAVATLALIVALPVSAHAAVPDGTIDSTFGSSGVATITATESDAIRGIAVQDDGKIITSGYYSTPGWSDGWNYYAARFNVDGTLDASFGTSGIVDLDIGVGHDVPRGMAVQNDGKILIGGDIEYQSGADYRVAIVRLNTDGSLDTSFGSAGIWIDPRGDRTTFGALAVADSGELLVSGRYTDFSNSWIMRLDSDGSTDTSFGTGGATNISGVDSRAESMAIDTTGRIVVGGNDAGDFKVWRFLTTGSLDTSFGASGSTTVTVGTGEANGRKLILSGAGIFLFGDGRLASTGNHAFTALKLTSDGSLDSSFGTAGATQATSDSAYENVALDAVQSSDGNFYLFGYQNTAGVTSGRVAALTVDGNIVSSFGTNGFATGFNGYYEVGAMQADGQILAAGGYAVDGSHQGFGIQRFSTLEYQEFLAEAESEAGSGSELANTGAGSPLWAASAALVALLGVGLVLARSRKA
ncbi:MAG: hypothetical protein RLZZ600_532 [Actinomycetota bacterium]